MIKKRFKGSEGYITAYAFWLLGKSWVFAKSETKWHEGEKYKTTPIWFSKIEGKLPAVFIGKVAIVCDCKNKQTN